MGTLIFEKRLVNHYSIICNASIVINSKFTTAMNKKKNNSKSTENTSNRDKDDNKEGYPLYPKNEDVYEKFEEESEINPEDISKTKSFQSSNAIRQEALDKKHILSGKDLDVPGSELDDVQEAIGNEDEENNYYSLGGDNHED